MNIVVCIKEVVDAQGASINPVTNTIMREKMETIINPFDMHALEEGIRLKERVGSGKVTVLSMGIPSVAEHLKTAIAHGAEEAILLSDKSFAGSDTLATAYTLSMGIKKILKFDLIVCGKQAIDGDTGQVGPSLAEKLGIPHATNVNKILEINDSFIICSRTTEYGYDLIEIKLPALITVSKDINEIRIPTLKNMMRARNAVITVWNAADINADTSCCGLIGSPTRVIRTFSPCYESKCEILQGSLEEQVNILVDKFLHLAISNEKI